MRTELSESEVREAGGTLERWRYRNLEDRDGTMGPRSLALEQLFRYRNQAPVGPERDPKPHFVDIKAKLVMESDWKCM